MRVKKLFTILLILLMAISISQMLPIPPHGDDVYPLYRSGYFSELEKEFVIISDAFLNLKSMEETRYGPEYGWIYLDDVSKKFSMKISVYDHEGERVPVPGSRDGQPDERVLAVINSLKPEVSSEIRNRKFQSIIPLFAEGRCKICHTRYSKRMIVGALAFERDYDAHIYYSLERVIIFLMIAIFLGFLLYVLLRWDPGKNIKELFDKK
jgi:hypothetical protein